MSHQEYSEREGVAMGKRNDEAIDAGEVYAGGEEDVNEADAAEGEHDGVVARILLKRLNEPCACRTMTTIAVGLEYREYRPEMRISTGRDVETVG